MKQQLVPFYVKAHQNRMGYALFIDLTTMAIYRLYNDNYRLWNSARFWVYMLGGYWGLKKLEAITMEMINMVGLLFLLLFGTAVFFYGWGFLYRKEVIGYVRQKACLSICRRIPGLCNRRA